MDEIQKVQEVEFPKKVKIDGQVVEFNFDENVKSILKQKLNLSRLIEDGMVQLSDFPVSLTFQECTLGYWDGDGIFIGQHNDGIPDGYIRFVDKDGRIYEGNAT